MKIFSFIILMLISSTSFAFDYEDLALEVENQNISFETILMLKELDDSSSAIGYGLCEAARRSGCDSSGSLGYGLCEAAGRSSCISNGSIGYGLCEMAGRSGCKSYGTIGYGMCEVSRRSGC